MDSVAGCSAASNQIDALVFIALIAMVLIAFAAHSKVLESLRASFPEIWERLGRPTLFSNNTVKNGLATQRFLWSSEASSLPDPGLVRLIRFLRWWSIAYLVTFLALLSLSQPGACETAA